MSRFKKYDLVEFSNRSLKKSHIGLVIEPDYQDEEDSCYCDVQFLSELDSGRQIISQMTIEDYYLKPIPLPIFEPELKAGDWIYISNSNPYSRTDLGANIILRPIKGQSFRIVDTIHQARTYSRPIYFIKLDDGTSFYIHEFELDYLVTKELNHPSLRKGPPDLPII